MLRLPKWRCGERRWLLGDRTLWVLYLVSRMLRCISRYLLSLFSNCNAVISPPRCFVVVAGKPSSSIRGTAKSPFGPATFLYDLSLWLLEFPLKPGVCSGCCWKIKLDSCRVRYWFWSRYWSRNFPNLDLLLVLGLYSSLVYCCSSLPIHYYPIACDLTVDNLHPSLLGSFHNLCISIISICVLLEYYVCNIPGLEKLWK